MQVQTRVTIEVHFLAEVISEWRDSLPPNRRNVVFVSFSVCFVEFLGHGTSDQTAVSLRLLVAKLFLEVRCRSRQVETPHKKRIGPVP